MKISSLGREEIINLLSQHRSIHAALLSLDVSACGSGAYKTFKRRCTVLGVNAHEHLNKDLGYPKRNGNGIIELKDILVQDSTYQNIGRLKTRMINAGLLEYRCYECGIVEWNSKPISLHLDHKNGIHNDHRKENIWLLCPNCHSQTVTYGGKNCRGQKRTTSLIA